MKILVTGGAGYIGSHTCVELLNEKYDSVVLDNLSNSSEESLIRVENITGKSLEFHKADLLDKNQITAVFKAHKTRKAAPKAVQKREKSTSIFIKKDFKEQMIFAILSLRKPRF